MPGQRAKRPRREHRGPIDIWTAARRGELLNLRWPDVDWKAPAFRIRGSVGMVDGARVEGTTKGGRERTVSLDVGTVEILKAHRRRQLEDLRVAGDSWVDTGHVFTTGFGLPIYPDTVSQLIAKSIKAYNEPADDAKAPEFPLPHARLHDLRHVHATLLLVAGVPVHVVADRLGHADPSVTLRVYAHVIRRHAAGIADVFAAAADQVDEDQGDDEDGPEASGLVPC